MHLNHYRSQLNCILQALVNKNVNMVKQLIYREICSKNIEIYLSKLYIGNYSEATERCDKVHAKIPASVNNINGGLNINYITCASGCFVM